MAELSKYDLELWKFKGAVKGADKQTNALATATVAAPGTSMRNRLVRVDASYSAAATSGLLQVKSGSTVIFEKYIHGAGSIEFSNYGIPANALNEAMSAELAAGGASVVGTVAISGFKHPESA